MTLPDEEHLKCRYCGSPDASRCGFRYNARDISRRYKCNECGRKFHIVHVQNNAEARPSQLTWLLSEIGMLMSKSELLAELNARMEITISLTKGTQIDPSSQGENENQIGQTYGTRNPENYPMREASYRAIGTRD